MQSIDRNSSSHLDNEVAGCRWRVLLTDRAWPDFEIERDVLAGVSAEVIEAPDASEQTLVRLAQNVDAIGTCWAQVTRAVIAAAPGCRVICRFGIGLDNIDVTFATECGIPVTNHPTYCIEEVAAQCVATILTFARKTAFYDRICKAGRYDLLAGPEMHRLSSQTLGIVGLGRIGSQLARYASSLGMKVAAFTRSSGTKGLPVSLCATLEELLAMSDFVSLHLPLTDNTRRLISDRQFQAMRPTAVLINTSRGGLVDQAALWRALQGNQLAGAALDVFESEPPDLSHPLFQDPRILVTPHAAFVSAESLVQLRRDSAINIRAALQGEPLQNVINRDLGSNQN